MTVAATGELRSYLSFLFDIVNRIKGTCTKRKLRYVQSPFSAWIRENSLPRLVTLGKDTLEKPIKHGKGLGVFEGMAQIWSRAIYESIEWKKAYWHICLHRDGLHTGTRFEPK